MLATGTTKTPAQIGAVEVARGEVRGLHVAAAHRTYHVVAYLAVTITIRTPTAEEVSNCVARQCHSHCTNNIVTNGL